MKFKTVALSIFAIIFNSMNTQAAVMSLEEYLGKVETESSGVKSSKAQIEGTLSTAKESDLLYIPRFNLMGSFNHDFRQFPNPFQAPTDTKNFSLGFDKQFNFGLSAKLTYSLIQTSYFPESAFLKNFSGGQTQLEFSQSLWRNFFGKETRATEDIAEAGSLVAHYGEKLKLSQTLAQAKIAYYRLATANESIKLEKELLEGSKKILDWTTKRVANHLSDKIDMLQAKSAYQAHLISMQNAEQEHRAARLAFNQFLNLNSDEVKSDVKLASTDSILAMNAPTRAIETLDVRTARQSERVTRASNELSLQKAQPELSLFGNAGFNAIAFNSMADAASGALDGKHTTYTLGVKLSYPLYFWETSEIRSGRVKQQLAAELNTQQKELESENNYKDLASKFMEAKSQLKMVDELVSLQKDKLEYEKYRFNLGRTTTYQVLMFEQDYAQALINRLRVENQILALHSQLQTFANE